MQLNEINSADLKRVFGVEPLVSLEKCEMRALKLNELQFTITGNFYDISCKVDGAFKQYYVCLSDFTSAHPKKITSKGCLIGDWDKIGQKLAAYLFKGDKEFYVNFEKCVVTKKWLQKPKFQIN